jgi:hypothetical protein
MRHVPTERLNLHQFWGKITSNRLEVTMTLLAPAVVTYSAEIDNNTSFNIYPFLSDFLRRHDSRTKILGADHLKIFNEMPDPSGALGIFGLNLATAARALQNTELRSG